MDRPGTLAEQTARATLARLQRHAEIKFAIGAANPFSRVTLLDVVAYRQMHPATITTRRPKPRARGHRARRRTTRPSARSGDSGLGDPASPASVMGGNA